MKSREELRALVFKANEANTHVGPRDALYEVVRAMLALIDACVPAAGMSESPQPETAVIVGEKNEAASLEWRVAALEEWRRATSTPAQPPPDELDQWRRYAAYLLACIRSGERDVHNFDAFLARSVPPLTSEAPAWDPSMGPPKPPKPPGPRAYA